MKNIVITGGAGYVGSVLVAKLLDLGHKITVLDLFIYGDHVLKHTPILLWSKEILETFNHKDHFLEQILLFI